MELDFPEKQKLLQIWRKHCYEASALQYFKRLQDLGAPWFLGDEEAKNGPKSGLCQICSNINFDWFLNHDFQEELYAITPTTRELWNRLEFCWPRAPGISQHSYTGFLSTGVPFGYLVDVVARQHCSFCCLLTQIVMQELGWQMNSYTHEKISGYGEYPPVKDYPVRDVVCSLISIDKGEEFGTQRAPVRFKAHAIQLKLCTKSFEVIRMYEFHRITPGPAPYGGRLVGRQANFETIKKWIGDCLQDGPDLWDLMDDEAKKQFRLVDTQDQCVVRISRAPPYIALSYVWGTSPVLMARKTTVEDLERPGSLAVAHVPETILDAMSVVARTGQRYLWVDSLCVVQDDENSKHSQIMAMDAIYRGALATIVAASSLEAGSGIPGVKPDSRSQWQVLAKVRNLVLANRWPQWINHPRGRQIDESVDCLPWSKRGWTFQENVLSRRKLYFLPDIVWFSDGEHVYEEDQYEDHSSRIEVSTIFDFIH